VDVAIIGAGIIGCAIARELTERGGTCTVIDDRPPAGGATQASAGMLAPYVEAHEPGPLRDLGVRSLDLYDRWIADLIAATGLNVEFRKTGTLEVALHPAHAAQLRAAAAAPRDAPAIYLDAHDVRRRYPALSAISGALFTPVHGYVAAQQLTAALVRAAQRRGASFLHDRVRAIRRARGGALEVATDGETIAARSVVIAAGAWTNDILVEGFHLPMIRPVRSQLLYLTWRGDPLDTIIWGPECYVVPRLDGTVLVGATTEEVGFDERATADAVRSLLDAACELLPAGRDASFLGARVGLRPASPDDLPVLGPDPRVAGLVHATGHYRNGVLLAPITARLIADWLTDARRDPVFGVLGPDRFLEQV
jgi:glycine oxidase